MDNKSLKKYRELLNKKERSSNYIINYDDNILITEKLKNFLGLQSDEISLLNLYRKINDIKLDSKLIELGNILNLNQDELINKLNLYTKLNNLLLSIN